ncbi:MAG TPA: serine/threonine-protein kinase, partial [Polyangiaceae bacterium]|nr:serine/threonine-protein kinase [Polyangiaceae bacterium]
MNRLPLSPEDTNRVTHGTTVHCPDCGAAVPTTADATAVACPACRTAFSPWGLPTAARAPISSGVAALTPTPGGPTTAGPDDLTGTQLDGRRLVRVIGRGGMGTVYEAEDRARGRVAVKVLPLALSGDRSFVERFRREAKVLASLSHPHLVEVLDRGEDHGRCFFVMEYVRGEGLRRLMERGPMPWRDALRVAREILTGLGYAHGRGVVHRDLKPENVLLDDAGRARLVDFGLSRIVRGEAAEAVSRLTRTDVILGTYEYMAPEQRLGAPNVDDRADLYAVGVILYEMLTGQLPLGRFPPASELRPGTPEALDEVIHRALATAPTDRFPSAVAFREAIERAELRASSPSVPKPAAGGAAAAAAALPLAAPPPPALTSEEVRIAQARGVLKHVDVLAAADRVIGVLMLLFFFGGVTLARGDFAGGFPWFLPWFLPIAGTSSVVYLIAGFLFLKQGRRLSRLEPGSREGQVTASLFQLILFPPFGTALGIYGLVTMTRHPAHEAFTLGRARLLGPVPPSPWTRPAPAASPTPESLRWHGDA